MRELLAQVLPPALGLVWAPLAIVAVAPRASAGILGAAGAWLGAHRRTLAIVICFGLGTYLLVHGLERGL